MDKDLRKQQLLYTASLLLREMENQTMQKIQPWKPGYIADGMSARAAIDANVAIGRMMRCGQ